MSLKFLSDLAPRSQLVVRPDHPLLLRGPEALIGAQDNLCAVFLPQMIELQNPAHLAARLVASRLALPRHTRTLLIVKRGETERLGELPRQFSLTTNRSDRSLPLFIRDGTDFGATKEMDHKQQLLAGEVFQNAMEFVELATDFDNRTETGIVRSGFDNQFRRVSRRLSMGSLAYEPRNRRVFGGVETSVIGGKSGAMLKRQINATLTGCILDNFELAEGIPYHKVSRSVLITVASEAREILNPSSKEVYAAAFLGAAVVTPRSSLTLELTVTAYEGYLKRATGASFE